MSHRKPTVRVDNAELCRQICRRLGVTRKNPDADILGKAEMLLISSALELRDEEIQTLRRRVAELERVLENKVAVNK